jgi:hypothetical protein
LFSTIFPDFRDAVNAALAGRDGMVQLIHASITELSEELKVLMFGLEDEDNAADVLHGLLAQFLDDMESLLDENGTSAVVTDEFLLRVEYAIAEMFTPRGSTQLEPGMIFPMVKEQHDMKFMRTEVIPAAENVAIRYLCLDNRASLAHISTGLMCETITAYDNREPIMGDPATEIVSVGNTDFAQSTWSRELAVDVKRDDRFFESFFTALKPSLCEKYYTIAQMISDRNHEYPGAPKTLYFCGVQAGTDEFILFASFLQKQFNNVRIYVSVPIDIVAQAELFIDYITEDDLSIFEQGIGFKTHELAHNKAQEVNARIEQSQEYKEYAKSNSEDLIKQSIGSPEYISKPAASGTRQVSYPQNAYSRIQSAA